MEKNTEQRLWLIQGNSKQTLTPMEKKAFNIYRS